MYSQLVKSTGDNLDLWQTFELETVLSTVGSALTPSR